MDLEQRRDFTSVKLMELKKVLGGSELEFSSKTCVYATGSYGRGEAGDDSDLDLFIAARAINDESGEKTPTRSLTRLSEIVLKANLIHATQQMGLPEFDGDGEYLRCYTNEELVKTLGQPEDDALNTFTARLLLLLESEPIIGIEFYSGIIDDVIAAYWRDYQDHKEEFMPSFLLNDILRLWRTFCVNYEARTKTAPRYMKNKRRVKNYKLKHSRIITCYSAVLELLAIYREQGTVHPFDFKGVVMRTPTQRIENLLASDTCSAAHDNLGKLLEAYQKFLGRTSIGGTALAGILDDNATHAEYMREANEFGGRVFECLKCVGEETQLFRHLVV